MKRRKIRRSVAFGEGIPPIPQSEQVAYVENPFVSEAQKRWMYANKPEMAKRWQEHTPKGKKLPARKGTANRRITANKRRLAHNKGGIIHNAVDPTKLDPTRTLTLRRSFFQELRKRFARLKGKIVRLLVTEDVFGLHPKKDTLAHFTNNCQPGQMRGTDGRCGPGIGVSIPREQMPQIKTDDMESFISFANHRGVKVEPWLILVQDLSPTQSEFRQERVDAITEDMMKSPILISKDRYILDGTHRWIKAWQKDKRSNIPTLRIDLPLRSALELMRAFPNAKFAENSAEPDPELEQERDLISLATEAKKRKDSPDYGQLFFKSETQEVWYVTADGDDRPFTRWLYPELERVRGVTKVTMEAESFPKQNDGWVQLYPRYKKWVHNTRWAFHNDPQKIRAFQSWLQQQITTDLTGDNKTAWDNYIQQGYAKGAGRAFDDTKRAVAAQAIGDQRKLDFYQGTRDEFLRSSFAQPVAREKIELLAQRAFDEMENVTDDVSTKISRTLADGLIQGKSPNDVAKDLNEQVDLGEARSKRVANTEIIRAHSEGQLTALENLGVEEVGVAVEWTTSGLNEYDKRGNPISPCARCKAMEGVVLKISEARGMIPLHPECKCTWLPANVGEDNEDQKSSKKEIEEAAQEADVDIDIDVERPESILNYLLNHAVVLNTFFEQQRVKNVFCATGEGGGVDPSCSKSEIDSIKKNLEAQKRSGERSYSISPAGVKLTTALKPDKSKEPQQRDVHLFEIHGRTDTTDFGIEAVDQHIDKHLTGSKDPITLVRSNDGKLVIDDGNHRFLAAILRGDSTIRANIYPQKVSVKNFNPDQPRDEHGQFAHLPDSSLKRMAKKAGLEHKGTRAELLDRLHKYARGTEEGAPSTPPPSPESGGPKGKSSALPESHGTVPPVVETKPTTSFDKAHHASSIVKSTERLGQENYNLVHLGDLRSAHSDLSKEQFDQALRHAQSSGKISLTPAEGRHGVSERDKNSAVYDKDEATGHDKMMLYASVRNILSPFVDNVFCPKGKGGGVDPTCKKPEGSRVSNPHERPKKDKSPTVKPFKTPPPKKPRGEGPLRPKGEKSQTKLGDKTEEAATKLGFRNILPEGKRTFTPKEVEEYGSSIDLEYDHSGKLYELKMCKTTSTEYRLKAKLEEKQAKEQFAKNVKATVHTLIGVYDEDKGETHFYSAKEPGLTGAEVSSDKFHYHGKVKM